MNTDNMDEISLKLEKTEQALKNLYQIVHAFPQEIIAQMDNYTFHRLYDKREPHHLVLEKRFGKS